MNFKETNKKNKATNKCPSKHDSLLTLLGKFVFEISKKQGEEDMNRKHLINFTSVIIV